MATRIRTALVGGVAALVLVACAARPTEDELARSILDATGAQASLDLTDEVASCIARQLLDSDLSDATLSGLATDFAEPEVLETELDEVDPVIVAAAGACQQGGS